MNIQGAADSIIISLEAELMSRVPKQIRQRVGKFRVQVQLGAELQELAGFAEDE